MMRRAIQVVCLGVLLGLPARPADKSLKELQAELSKANTRKRADLLLEIARLQLEDANQAFTDGKPADGHAGVQATLNSVEEAVKAAHASGKGLKKSEIKVRKLAGRMEDIARTLAIDDRPPVEKTVKRMLELSDELLKDMFDLEHPNKEKS